ncbi:MAG: translation initiation factor IF-2 [Candidatus Pacebacteria bacterium]|nr:translation initiation factor IF-2 [Candidatus Paceibacterota bacterium]
MTNEIENKKAKQPVVVVMGHVDHGKSSLLEAIREDFVITAKESGGITQHIGAYEVAVPSAEGDQRITFIDTPGHEAFSAMRQRGAKVADIAILVVDAVEGVKDQTKEAIKFIKTANIPMLVAFNKIDKPGADAEKVKQQLSQNDVLVESWGGKVPSVKVSAKMKQGIKELLETILLMAEMEELKADLLAIPQGTVIESSLDAKKGAIATLVLEKGILKNGDIVGTNSAFGKIKRLLNFQGREASEIFPGQPCRVLGFETPPVVGEVVVVCECLNKAKDNLKIKDSKVQEKPKQLQAEQEGEEVKKIFNVIVKADVHGSLEAIEHILQAIPTEKVGLRVLRYSVGDINANDVKEAESINGAIFGFRVKVDESTKFLAQQKRVKIRIFEVIYEMVQEARQEMLIVLAPEIKRIDLSQLKIIAYFKKAKDTQIIGGKVLEGEFTKNTMVEVFRNDEMIGKGRIKSLEREKKEVGKAIKGQEVGMMFSGDIKIEIDDVFKIYREEKQKGTL